MIQLGEKYCTIFSELELEVSMKLIRLIKMCLNETNSKVHIGKHLPHHFLIENCLKQGDALSPLL
jgi:hypothetical protein